MKEFLAALREVVTDHPAATILAIILAGGLLYGDLAYAYQVGQQFHTFHSNVCRLFVVARKGDQAQYEFYKAAAAHAAERAHLDHGALRVSDLASVRLDQHSELAAKADIRFRFPGC